MQHVVLDELSRPVDLQRILRGENFEAIAREIYLSRGHAENLAQELYQMHGVTSRAELAGIYLGLRDPTGIPSGHRTAGRPPRSTDEPAGNTERDRPNA